MKKLKVVGINLTVFVFLTIILELIFGGWLNKENYLNGLMITRNRVLKFDLNGLYPYDKEVIDVTKDKFGFRGSRNTLNRPESIDILCIGGSTTYQRLIEDGHTWSEVLENSLKENGLNFNVANAGVDGQSTFGHIKGFELWFPQVPNLRPKYILFFFGINDFYILKTKMGSDEIKAKGTDFVKEEIRNNSALYNLYIVIEGSFLAKINGIDHSKVVFSHYDYGAQGLLDTLDFTSFFKGRLEAYEQRLEHLVNLSEKMGATPVFITQPSRRFKFDEEHQVIGVQEVLNHKFSGFKLNGVDYYSALVEMNKVIKKVANEHSLKVIDQTRLDIWEDEDFYDFSHTTPVGSKKIGEAIANELIPFFKGR